MNLWLILALAAIVIGLIVSLLPRSRANALFVTAASAAGVALIWLGTMRYSKSTILAEASKRSDGADLFGIGGRVDRTIDATIQVDWHFGFYLALVALIAAGVMAWLSYSGRDAVAQGPAFPPSPAEAEPPLTCPTCGRSHPAATRFCPDDGTALR